MSARRQAFGVVSAVAVVAGTAGAVAAFWLEAHRRAIDQPAVGMALGMAVFFVGYSVALWRYLRWRDEQHGLISPLAGPMASGPTSPVPALHTVHDLRPGVVYSVTLAFSDYHAGRFEPGERLTFRQRHFLPYHGGHTLVFDERSVYLQEDEQRLILEGLADYLVVLPP